MAVSCAPVAYPRSAYFNDFHGRCFVEMELFSSDLLDDILSKGTLDDARASKVARFLAAALDHLHRRGVAHCDVKLQNVFIRDSTVKLGDLGPSSISGSLLRQRSNHLQRWRIPGAGNARSRRSKTVMVPSLRMTPRRAVPR